MPAVKPLSIRYRLQGERVERQGNSAGEPREKGEGDRWWWPWTISVPGRFMDAIAYADALRRERSVVVGISERVAARPTWSAFLAGVATSGKIVLVESAWRLKWFVEGVREAIGEADTIMYRATNTLIEGIAEGRFTYARRG